MKNIVKNKIYRLVIVLVMALSIGAFVQSCSTENDSVVLEEYEGIIPSPLFGYFKSSDYSDLNKNFKISTNNIDFNNIVTENFEDIDVALYYLPVNQNGENIGVLCVVSKDKGNVYKAVYEDRTEIRNKNIGKTSIYTSQGFFIADFHYEQKSKGEYSFRINDVVSSNKFLRLKSGVEIEWPTSEDSWLDCLSKCYTAAHIACSSNPDCSFLLNISNGIDYVGTLSIGAACAIYCVFD
jgi:hypothetical protein